MEKVIAVLISIVIGYGLGCVSPSAFISKIKQKNLREHGTKNLGASNVALTFGKGVGAVVMVLDILKAFIAFKLSAFLFPVLPIAGVIAGLASVVGHIFPFYLGFKGGKGLAAFAGLILALDPLLFLFLLISGVAIMLIVNQSCALSYYAAVFAPIWVGIHTHSAITTLCVIGASLLILYKHFENLKKAITHSDIDIRGYIKTHIFKSKKD